MTSKNLLITLLVLVIVASIGISVFLFSTKYASFKSGTAISTEETTKLSEESISQAEIDKLPGCVVAFSKEVYPGSIRISNETKNLIKHYIKSWQDVCSGKSERSLYPLWIESQKIFNLLQQEAGYNPNSLESDDLPLFLPGFEMNSDSDNFTADWLDFTPRTRLFAENVKLGTQEDRNFFTTYSSLHFYDDMNFLPWIEPTWDYGGCTLYGTYKWTNSFQALDDLSKKIKNSDYLESIHFSREKILLGLTYDNIYYYQGEEDGGRSKPELSSICSCGGKKEAVLNDLEKVLQYITTNSSYSYYYRDSIYPITDIITKIKKGEVKVLSETERECSGG